MAAADRRAALVLLVAGLSVPLFQAVFGIGAAAASRRQFTALSRLQNRFSRPHPRDLDHRAGGPRPKRRSARWDVPPTELRRRTMRVLRVAFLSSAALDCAQAAALVLIAVADRHLLLGHPEPFGAARAVFALLAVARVLRAAPRLRARLSVDRHRIAGVAAELGPRCPRCPPHPARPAAVRNVEAHGVAIAFEDVALRL